MLPPYHDPGSLVPPKIKNSPRGLGKSIRLFLSATGICTTRLRFVIVLCALLFALSTALQAFTLAVREALT